MRTLSVRRSASRLTPGSLHSYRFRSPLRILYSNSPKGQALYFYQKWGQVLCSWRFGIRHKVPVPLFCRKKEPGTRWVGCGVKKRPGFAWGQILVSWSVKLDRLAGACPGRHCGVRLWICISRYWKNLRPGPFLFAREHHSFLF
jgi:hypothetical protein